MRGISDLKKRLEKLEKRKGKQYPYLDEDGYFVNLSVQISDKPDGEVVGRFDNLDEAKKFAKLIARKHNIGLSWLIDSYSGSAPYYVIIDEERAKVVEVEIDD